MTQHCIQHAVALRQVGAIIVLLLLNCLKVSYGNLLASSRLEICDNDGVSEMKCGMKLSATATVQNSQVCENSTVLYRLH